MRELFAVQRPVIWDQLALLKENREKPPAGGLANWSASKKGIYGKKRFRKYSGFNKPLALARGQWLQAASGKLQASGGKLDKKEL